IAEFLTDMLKGVGPSVASGRDTALLREILERTTERVSNGLTNQPMVEVELLTIIGEVYDALAEYEKSEEVHRRTLAILRSLPGQDEAGTIGKCLNRLGQA